MASMSKLVEHVSKKPVPEHQKNVIFEITAGTRRKRMSRSHTSWSSCRSRLLELWGGVYLRADDDLAYCTTTTIDELHE